MNNDKWEKAPMSRLVVKLTERTGKVAGSYLDVIESHDKDTLESCLKDLTWFLGHVETIAAVMRVRVAEAVDGVFDAKTEDDDGER